MPKYAKLIIGITILLFFAVCLFFLLAPKNVQNIEFVEAEESVEYSTTMPLYNDFLTPEYVGLNHTEISSQRSGSVRLFTGSIMVVDVVWVNFKDCAVFSEMGEIFYLELLEQISDFFWEESCHTLTIKYNIYQYYHDGKAEDFGNQKYSCTEEYKFFEEAKSNSVEKCYYGKADKAFVLFSYDWDAKSDSYSWPHVWMTYSDDKPSLCMSASNQHFYDYCHEFYHLLGINDLYNTNLHQNEDVDIMQGRKIEGITTSANNKLNFGWIDESDYEDSRVSGIENIYKNDTYTLKSPTSLEGTIAYKFGVSRNEFFLVEQRIFKESQYLIIQKINTEYNSNIYAKDISEFYIYTYAKNIFTSLFEPRDSIGNKYNPLTYSDGTRANYYINNIQINNNQTISFDFYSSFPDNFDKPAETITNSQLNHNYYINVIDQYGNEVILSEMSLFNSETNKYEKVNEISIVYINRTPFYALLNIDNKYTNCKLIFTSYCFSSENVVNFSIFTSHYFVELEKNFIQLTGDNYYNFISLIKDTFLSFFAK